MCVSHQNCLNEAVLMSTHNIMFPLRNVESYPKLSPLHPLTWSCVLPGEKKKNVKGWYCNSNIDPQSFPKGSDGAAIFSILFRMVRKESICHTRLGL